MSKLSAFQPMTQDGAHPTSPHIPSMARSAPLVGDHRIVPIETEGIDGVSSGPPSMTHRPQLGKSTSALSGLIPLLDDDAGPADTTSAAGAKGSRVAVVMPSAAQLDESNAFYVENVPRVTSILSSVFHSRNGSPAPEESQHVGSALNLPLSPPERSFEDDSDVVGTNSQRVAEAVVPVVQSTAQTDVSPPTPPTALNIDEDLDVAVELHQDGSQSEKQQTPPSKAQGSGSAKASPSLSISAPAAHPAPSSTQRRPASKELHFLGQPMPSEARCCFGEEDEAEQDPSPTYPIEPAVIGAQPGRHTSTSSSLTAGSESSLPTVGEEGGSDTAGASLSGSGSAFAFTLTRNGGSTTTTASSTSSSFVTGATNVGKLTASYDRVCSALMSASVASVDSILLPPSSGSPIAIGTATTTTTTNSGTIHSLNSTWNASSPLCPVGTGSGDSASGMQAGLSPRPSQLRSPAPSARFDTSAPGSPGGGAMTDESTVGIDSFTVTRRKKSSNGNGMSSSSGAGWSCVKQHGSALNVLPPPTTSAQKTAQEAGDGDLVAVGSASFDFSLEATVTPDQALPRQVPLRGSASSAASPVSVEQQESPRLPLGVRRGMCEASASTAPVQPPPLKMPPSADDAELRLIEHNVMQMSHLEAQQWCIQLFKTLRAYHRHVSTSTGAKGGGGGGHSHHATPRNATNGSSNALLRRGRSNVGSERPPRPTSPQQGFRGDEKERESQHHTFSPESSGIHSFNPNPPVAPSSARGGASPDTPQGLLSTTTSALHHIRRTFGQSFVGSVAGGNVSPTDSAASSLWCAALPATITDLTGLAEEFEQATKPYSFDEYSDINNYTLLRLLARGSQGEVWLAYDNVALEERAIKRVRRGIRQSYWAQICTEIQILSRVTHQCVIRLYEVINDRSKNEIFLVFKLAAGGTLPQFTDETHMECQRIDPATLVVYGRQLSSGLAHLHRSGVAHRDVKPENFLKGDDHQVYVADLGLAVNMEDVRNGLAPEDSLEWQQLFATREPQQGLSLDSTANGMGNEQQETKCHGHARSLSLGSAGSSSVHSPAASSHGALSGLAHLKYPTSPHCHHHRSHSHSSVNDLASLASSYVGSSNENSIRQTTAVTPAGATNVLGGPPPPPTPTSGPRLSALAEESSFDDIHSGVGSPVVPVPPQGPRPERASASPLHQAKAKEHTPVAVASTSASPFIEADGTQLTEQLKHTQAEPTQESPTRRPQWMALHGTLAFQPPEYFDEDLRAASEQSLDAAELLKAADVFALGISFYFLLYGVHPFAANNPLRAADKELQGKPIGDAIKEDKVLFDGIDYMESGIGQGKKTELEKWNALIRGMLVKNPVKRMKMPEVQRSFKKWLKATVQMKSTSRACRFREVANCTTKTQRTAPTSASASVGPTSMSVPQPPHSGLARNTFSLESYALDMMVQSFDEIPVAAETINSTTTTMSAGTGLGVAHGGSSSTSQVPMNSLSSGGCTMQLPQGLFHPTLKQQPPSLPTHPGIGSDDGSPKNSNTSYGKLTTRSISAARAPSQRQLRATEIPPGSPFSVPQTRISSPTTAVPSATAKGGSGSSRTSSVFASGSGRNTPPAGEADVEPPFSPGPCLLSGSSSSSDLAEIDEN